MRTLERTTIDYGAVEANIPAPVLLTLAEILRDLREDERGEALALREHNEHDGWFSFIDGTDREWQISPTGYYTWNDSWGDFFHGAIKGHRPDWLGEVRRGNRG